MFSAVIGSVLAGVMMMAVMPSTNTYQLNSYGFGSGGTANSSTGNYSLEGISGEVSSQADSTSTYTLKPGYVETQQANVPTVTLTNPSNYYDKLHLVIGQQNNPSDALYALQVCVGGDFPCGGTILYVKSDHTLGSTLTVADYQGYASLGSGTGINIIGLSTSTTYYIRAKATQGTFTESAYGPSSNAATSAQEISFCLYTNANCGAGGTSETFSGLVAGSVTNSPSNIGVDFATNADAGGSVYIYSNNGGLVSTTAPGSPITSATADLSSASQGFGARVASVTSLTVISPYDGSGNNVGVLGTTANTILNTNSPVAGGAAAIQLQAKASNTTPAATDYAEVLTIIAAARF